MYRFQLPEDFLIGTANSAFQSEGAWDRDGKSESIMDHFARKYAGKLSPAEQRKLDAGRSPDQVRPNSLEMPDRGCFFYDNYEAYIEDMQKTGQNTYRMSLSWPRILPDGVGAVNQLAIDHYNRVIDKLLSCSITPFVDLYHWDLPMCLFEQGGFLNPEFPAWFENYARVCFTAFGDRVKLWSTFNETQISLNGGFDSGGFPPFRQNKREALLGGHHVLLAHFRAVRLMGEHSVYITVQICFDLLAGIQVGIRQHGGDGFPGRKRQQLARGGCGILTFCGQQSPPGLQIQISVLLYHRSAPASSGRTSFSASMPTSSMESSGSLVVKFWNHMPGAVRIRVSQLSWRPTRRLNS